MGGRRVAVLAAAIAALVPGLVVLPLTSGGSAGPFTLLVVTTVWLALRARRRLGPPPRCSWPRARASASGSRTSPVPRASRSRSSCSRCSLLPVLGGWRGLRNADGGSWKRAGSARGAFLVPLVLVAAPYVVYLHDHTGQWELTAKTRDVSIASWRAVAEEHRPARQTILYNPGEDRLRLPGDALARRR